MTWIAPAGPGGGGAGGLFARADSNLPFGGIPPELQAGVDKLLKGEPELKEPDINFDYSSNAYKGFKKITLRSLLKKHIGLLILGSLLTISIALFSQAGPKIIELAVDKAVLPKNMGRLIGFGVAYFVFALLSAYCQRWQVKVTGRLAGYVSTDLRTKIFDHLQRLSMDFYTEEKSGVIMTRMTSDVENLQTLLRDGLVQILTQALTMIVILAILINMSPLLALITSVVSIPPLVILSLWFRSASEKTYSLVRDKLAAVLADLSENLHGIRISISFNRQKLNIVKHNEILRQYKNANNKTGLIAAIYGPATQMLGILSQAVLLGVGSYLITQKEVSIGALIAFFLYLNRFFQPIQLLVQQYNSYQQGYASIHKINGLLSIKPSVLEKPSAIELPDIKGEVQFKDVYFGYDDVVVLKGINVKIEPNQRVAVVGPTGAGKSTFTKLITRFYEVKSGQILIDGYDIRDVSIRSLRRQIGVVPQEPYLFEGTVRYNLTFGSEDVSEEEIQRALYLTGLDEVLKRAGLTLDSFISERGQSLSSGERQLVSLARAFIYQPRIIILDEATSNIDSMLEEKIEHGLELLLEGRTSIIVAHRLATAEKADRILVFNDGKIVQDGPHSALVAQEGLYKELFKIWSKQHSVVI
jgi:ATP-binding cassette subfamily B protein